MRHPGDRRGGLAVDVGRHARGSLRHRRRRAQLRASEADDAAGEERHDDDEQQALDVEPLRRELLADSSSWPSSTTIAPTPRRASTPGRRRRPSDHEDRRQHVELVGATMPMIGDEHARRRGPPCPGRHANATSLDDRRVVAEEAHAVLAVADGDEQLARSGCARAAGAITRNTSSSTTAAMK